MTDGKQGKWTFLDKHRELLCSGQQKLEAQRQTNRQTNQMQTNKPKQNKNKKQEKQKQKPKKTCLLNPRKQHCEQDKVEDSRGMWQTSVNSGTLRKERKNGAVHEGAPGITITKSVLSLTIASPFYPVQVTMTMEKRGEICHKNNRLCRVVTSSTHKMNKQSHKQGQEAGRVHLALQAPKTEKQVAGKGKSLGEPCPLISPAKDSVSAYIP